MNIDFDLLKKLPVYTKNEVYLGKIISLEIDLINHKIKYYFISKGTSIVKAFVSPLLVPPEKIIEITQDKVIVEDALIKEKFLKEDVSLKMKKETGLEQGAISASNKS